MRESRRADAGGSGVINSWHHGSSARRASGWRPPSELAAYGTLSERGLEVGERGMPRRRFANFRIQATAGGMRCSFSEGAASPAAPDPER